MYEGKRKERKVTKRNSEGKGKHKEIYGEVEAQEEDNIRKV